MKIEDVVGYWIAQGREQAGKSQGTVGVELGEHLGKPWPRQAVSAAENGRRAFTAAELIAFSMVLGCTIETLFQPPPGVEKVELGDGVELDARYLRTTAGTNADLVALVDAIQSQRDQMEDVRSQVQMQRELQRVVASEMWKAARGRGIEAAEEQAGQRWRDGVPWESQEDRA